MRVVDTGDHGDSLLFVKLSKPFLNTFKLCRESRWKSGTACLFDGACCGTAVLEREFDRLVRMRQQDHPASGWGF